MTQEPFSIFQTISDLARRTPDAPAILAPGRAPLSYDGLARQAMYVRETLNAWGLGRGDRIAIVLPDGLDMAVSFLTVAACATSAPLNPKSTPAEFEFCLHDFSVRAVIVPGGAETPARAVATRLGIGVIELDAQDDARAGVFRLSGGQPGTPARAGPAQPRDIGLVLHTSGTTSRPKIVPLRQSDMTAKARKAKQAFRLTPEDRCLNVMPLFHGHGLFSGLLAPIGSGGSTICPPPFETDAFFRLLDEFCPTWYTAGFTYHHAILRRAPEYPDAIKRHRLRIIVTGSGRLAPDALLALERAFGVPVIERYSLTETGILTANPLPPGKRKPGTVGVPVGGEVAVMDAHGNILPPGETGEVVVRDSGVIDGYENNPQANAQSFDDGWFKTGDQGHFDDDGYLTLSGRIKDVINRGGEKISPHEVEDVLASAAEVAEAVCFPVAHRTLGEEIAAAVVLREGEVVSEDDLRTFAFERLAPSKVPRRIFIVDALPKGPTGKLQRTRLAQQLTRAGSALGALGGVGKSP